MQRFRWWLIQRLIGNNGTIYNVEIAGHCNITPAVTTVMPVKISNMPIASDNSTSFQKLSEGE